MQTEQRNGIAEAIERGCDRQRNAENNHPALFLHEGCPPRPFCSSLGSCWHSSLRASRAAQALEKAESEQRVQELVVRNLMGNFTPPKEDYAPLLQGLLDLLLWTVIQPPNTTTQAFKRFYGSANLLPRASRSVGKDTLAKRNPPHPLCVPAPLVHRDSPCQGRGRVPAGRTCCPAAAGARSCSRATGLAPSLHTCRGEQ